MAIALTPFAFVGVSFALALSPEITGRGVTLTQPVPFSHEHHAGGLGLDCRFCHGGVESSAVAGVPATETCMTCHSQIWTNAAMLAPVRASFATGVPLRWKRVNALPDYVYFDHSVHVAKGIGCSTCHGNVDRMALMRQDAPLTMSWCLDCHRDPKPYLRSPDEVFAAEWGAPADQAERGARLLKQYHIAIRHLTDCSVCHR